MKSLILSSFVFLGAFGLSTAHAASSLPPFSFEMVDKRGLSVMFEVKRVENCRHLAIDNRYQAVRSSATLREVVQSHTGNGKSNLRNRFDDTIKYVSRLCVSHFDKENKQIRETPVEEIVTKYFKLPGRLAPQAGSEKFDFIRGWR